MEAFIFANPWISLDVLRPPEEDVPSSLLFLRRVVTYPCLRPRHPPGLLAAVAQESCSHSILQTQSREACQAVLLLAIYEPLALKLAKPPGGSDQETDGALSSYLHFIAAKMALSLNLDTAIYDMCSGPAALTSASPWRERITRLQDASLWLAVCGAKMLDACRKAKPLLPLPHPSQSDIESFHANVMPLLDRSTAQAIPTDRQGSETWPTPNWSLSDKRLKLGGSFLAMAHQANFFHRVCTFLGQVDGYELHSFCNIDYIASCASELTQDTERLHEVQRDTFGQSVTRGLHQNRICVQQGRGEGAITPSTSAAKG